MNYLVPTRGRPNIVRRPSAEDNLIHVDNMYKSSIISSDGKDAFYGYVPEDFNIDLANEWEPIGGLGEAIPGLSGVVDAVDSVSKRVIGGKTSYKYASPQTWSGPSFLSLTLPFELNSWTSSAEDVQGPLVSMLRLITPETDVGGRMKPPGPSPIAQALESYRKQAKEGNVDSIDANSMVEGKIFTCTIGKFFRMSPCVITNVSAAVDAQFEHDSGLPTGVVMNVQILSYWPVDRKDIENWFYASKYGLGDK